MEMAQNQTPVDATGNTAQSLAEGYKTLSSSLEVIAANNNTVKELTETAKKLGDTESVNSLTDLQNENMKTVKESIGESFTMIGDQIEAIGESATRVFNRIATQYEIPLDDIISGKTLSDGTELSEEDSKDLRIAIISYRNVLQLQDPTEFRTFVMQQPKLFNYLGNYSAIGRTHKALRGFMRTSNLNLRLDNTLSILKKYGTKSESLKNLAVVLELYMLYVLELKRTKKWTNNVIFISLFASMITASATGNRKLAAQDGIIAAAKLGKVKQN